VEEANQRFLRAVAVDAAYHGGYRGLGAVTAMRGNRDEAEELLRTAHQLAPDDPGVLADLAGLYIDAGHHEQGIELYQRAIEQAPKRPEYRYGLAESYVVLGRTEDARQTVEQSRGLRLRDAHFRGAAEDLLLRAALEDVEQVLENAPLDAAACATARDLIEEANGHLDGAMAAGIEGEVSKAERRRVEELRVRVDRQCAASDT